MSNLTVPRHYCTDAGIAACLTDACIAGLMRAKCLLLKPTASGACKAWDIAFLLIELDREMVRVDLCWLACDWGTRIAEDFVLIIISTGEWGKV